MDEGVGVGVGTRMEDLGGGECGGGGGGGGGGGRKEIGEEMRVGEVVGRVDKGGGRRG